MGTFTKNMGRSRPNFVIVFLLRFFLFLFTYSRNTRRQCGKHQQWFLKFGPRYARRCAPCKSFHNRGEFLESDRSMPYTNSESARENAPGRQWWRETRGMVPLKLAWSICTTRGMVPLKLAWSICTIILALPLVISPPPTFTADYCQLGDIFVCR